VQNRVFLGDGDGGFPPIALDGTFEGSELFVKILNDQTNMDGERWLDWQASLLLGNDISVSWNKSAVEPDPTSGGPPLELLPETIAIPAGSGPPPLPVVRSTANFSDFFEFEDLTHNYGYDGIPFVSPAIFYVDDISDAYSFWTTVNTTEMFPPAKDPWDNFTVDIGATLGANFELSVELTHFDSSDAPDIWYYQNISIWANWDSTGFLTDFEIQVFGDINKNGVLDADEEFYWYFELVDSVQPFIPLSVGDNGEYLLDIFFEANYENKTTDPGINDLLDAIEASINGLDGKHLLNYSVDSMDGLYYHLDGYLLDLPRFMQHQLGYLFGGGPPPGEETLTIEDYYLHLSDMSDQHHGYSDFAINLFDASPYQNTTLMYHTMGLGIQSGGMEGFSVGRSKLGFQGQLRMDETKQTHLL